MKRETDSRLSSLDAGDEIPLDMLKAIVGGVGQAKKQDLTFEEAASLTAGTEHASVPQSAAGAGQPAGDMKPSALPKGEAASVEDKFREGLSSKPDMLSGAGRTGGLELSGAILGGEPGKALKDASWQKTSFGTAYDHRDQEAQAARKDFETARGASQDAAGKMQTAVADAATSAKAWAAVDAAKADLDKAKERGHAPGQPDTAKWHEERLAAAKQQAQAGGVPDHLLQTRAQDAVKAADAAKVQEAKAKEKADDLAARNNKAAVDAERVQKDRDTLKNMARDEGWGKGVGLVHSAQLDAAKQAAVDKGTYSEKKYGGVLAGGTDTVTATRTVGDLKITETVETIAQVKTDGSTKSFVADGVGAKSAEWAIRAEAGAQKTTVVVDAATGAIKTEQSKAYASAAFENRASVEVSDVKVAAEASSKVVGHAEVSISSSTKHGNVEVKDTLSASVHGEAGVRAGASLGFDGIKLGASASAEITAKADWTKEVKVGDVSIKNELEVFATAKAEAKASAEVNFNPFSGEKVGAKVALGAEASAGVGIQDTISLGDKLAVGGGLYAGKVGVKADVDLGFKDGKLGVNLDVGASLGVGYSVKIKAEADFAGTAKKAANDIKTGDLAGKAKGVLSFVPTVFVIRSLFG